MAADIVPVRLGLTKGDRIAAYAIGGLLNRVTDGADDQVRYVKPTFFRGTSLDPTPPGASKTPRRATSTPTRTTHSTQPDPGRGCAGPAGYRREALNRGSGPDAPDAAVSGGRGDGG